MRAEIEAVAMITGLRAEGSEVRIKIGASFCQVVRRITWGHGILFMTLGSQK